MGSACETEHRALMIRKCCVCIENKFRSNEFADCPFAAQNLLLPSRLARQLPRKSVYNSIRHCQSEPTCPIHDIRIFADAMISKDLTSD